MSSVTTLLVQVGLIVVDRRGTKSALARVSLRCLRRGFVSVGSLGRRSCGWIEDKICLLFAVIVGCICSRGSWERGMGLRNP